MVDRFSRDDLTAALAGRYLAGRCTAFAVAVHRRTQWPLVVLRTASGAYAHAGCLAPDGRFADARGLLDAAGFADGFAGDRIEGISEAQALAEHPQDEGMIEQADLHAELLLDLPGESRHRRRAEAFATALEGLCREHGFWLRGPGPGVQDHFVAYEAYGSEGPFRVTLLPTGGALIERSLGG